MGGRKIIQPGYVVPGGENIQGGGRILRNRLPPGPGGQPIDGGKINWDTGTIVVLR